MVFFSSSCFFLGSFLLLYLVGALVSYPTIYADVPEIADVCWYETHHPLIHVTCNTQLVDYNILNTLVQKEHTVYGIIRVFDNKYDIEREL